MIRAEQIADMDLRSMLPRIKEAVAARIERGESPRDLIAALAERDALALADVVVGPQAVASPLLVQAALDVLGPLEKAVAPTGLYRRLVALGGGREALAAAARRHPAASWLLDLSERVEGEQAGATHLEQAAGHPSFTNDCWTHAEAGHVRGLVAAALATGRPEPVAALAAFGHVDAAAEAAARALDTRPDTPVLAHLAAAWGPDIDAVACRVVPHLRSRAAAQGLVGSAEGLERTNALLAAILPGLAG